MQAMQEIACYLHEKYQVRSCFKVPRPPFIAKYHALSPALLKLVAL